MLRRMLHMSLPEFGYFVHRKASLQSLSIKEKLGFETTAQLLPAPASIEFLSAERPQLPTLPWSVDVPPAPDLQDEQPEWHKSPDTGQQWPRRLFSQVFGGPENPFGDVQLFWNRNRLQDLVTWGLICAHSNDGNARDLAAGQIGDTIRSWVSANPWPIGANYLSPFECALRMLSVCHSYDLARDHIEDRLVQDAVLQLVNSHARHIANRICLYSAAGNHTLGECAGLIYAGLLFPELPEAAQWFNTGERHFRQQVELQILEDGGNRERSLRYLVMVADLCGLVAATLEHRERPVPPEIAAATRRSRAFLQALADEPDGLPPVGDSDDGYTLSRYLRLSWQNNAPTNTAPVTLHATGITRIPGRAAGEQLFFLHSSLGTAAGFGHGHADALSVIYEREGVRLLTDPGTYLYGRNMQFRRYFRGTSAHNTVMVDGRDQSLQPDGTDFGWQRPYESELTRVETLEDGSRVFLAMHNGYLDQGIVHWRAVIQQTGDRWVIWDRLIGTGTQMHEFSLQWHVDGDVDHTQTCFRLGNKDRPVYLRITGGIPGVDRGNGAPPFGWISRTYGTKEPLNTLRALAVSAVPHEFTTIISGDMNSCLMPGIEESLLNTLRKHTDTAATINQKQQV